MTHQVAKFASLLGRRLALWFAVAWNAMFALWIISGGLEVQGVYTTADAQAAALPIILTWAAVNVCLLVGWHTVSTRTRRVAA